MSGRGKGTFRTDKGTLHQEFVDALREVLQMEPLYRPSPRTDEERFYIAPVTIPKKTSPRSYG